MSEGFNVCLLTCRVIEITMKLIILAWNEKNIWKFEIPWGKPVVGISHIC